MDKGLQPSAVFALIILCIVGGYWLAMRAYAMWTRYRRLILPTDQAASSDTSLDSPTSPSAQQFENRLLRVEHKLTVIEEALDRWPSAEEAGNRVSSPASMPDSMESNFSDTIPDSRPIDQEEVRRCVRDGLTPEQIARQLNLSRREVTLLLALRLPDEAS